MRRRTLALTLVLATVLLPAAASTAAATETPGNRAVTVVTPGIGSPDRTADPSGAAPWICRLFPRLCVD